MFEPPWDWNPHSFGKMSLSWFFLKNFWKQIGSKVVWPNHLGKNSCGKICIFVEIICFDPSEIGVLGLTWRVTLQFADLVREGFQIKKKSKKNKLPVMFLLEEEKNLIFSLLKKKIQFLDNWN